jgi:hypothetical protein
LKSGAGTVRVRDSIKHTSLASPLYSITREAPSISALGHRLCVITDESTLADFLPGEDLPHRLSDAAMSIRKSSH